MYYLIHIYLYIFIKIYIMSIILINELLFLIVLSNSQIAGDVTIPFKSTKQIF